MNQTFKAYMTVAGDALIGPCHIVFFGSSPEKHLVGFFGIVFYGRIKIEAVGFAHRFKKRTVIGFLVDGFEAVYRHRPFP